MAEQSTKPKPDYYMSAESRNDGNGYSKQQNYTLKVWENTNPTGIVVEDLKEIGQELTYASMKDFGTDWMHATELLNYQP